MSTRVPPTSGPEQPINMHAIERTVRGDSGIDAPDLITFPRYGGGDGSLAPLSAEGTCISVHRLEPDFETGGRKRNYGEIAFAHPGLHGSQGGDANIQHEAERRGRARAEAR